MYAINLEKVSQDNSLSALVRITARQLMDNPYITLGDFCKSLNAVDLASLDTMAASFDTNEEAQNNLIVLVDILSTAEGAQQESSRELAANVDYFYMLIGAMGLERKGLVDIIYENLTFGREFDDKEIVRIRDKKDGQEK